MNKLKKALFGSLAALVLTVTGCKFTESVEPKHAEFPKDPYHCEQLDLTKPYVNNCFVVFKDPQLEGQSTVKLANMCLHAILEDGKDTVIVNDEYNNNAVCGGLWPFWNFDDTLREELPSMVFENDCVIIPVSERPQKIWHLYSCKKPRAKIPEGTVKCYIEADFSIEGKSARVGFGIDSWTDSIFTEHNNYEIAFSDWYYKEGHHHIEVCKE